MFFTLYQIIRTARPRQWLKNLSLFAAPILAGRFFLDEVFPLSMGAFFAFCALSSGAYFLNDIVDADKDKAHPIKKNRPIASGKLSKPLAIIVCIVLILGSIIWSDFYVGTYFVYSMIFYIVVQLAYSFFVRNIIILDSLTVASGFVIRVFAGGLASQTSVSSWLALTTIGISLLMAFGKRRSEKTILEKYIGAKFNSETRQTLRHYPDTLLDSMISMSAAYTIITYSLYTFQVSPQGINHVLYNVLPSILRSPKWMMLTIPLVIYGVARYLYVIYEKEEGESPERALLADKPLLITVFSWGLIVLGITYLLPLLG